MQPNRSCPSMLQSHSGTGAMIRPFAFVLALGLFLATSKPIAAATITFYDNSAAWTSAIAAQPDLSISAPVTMDGGINTGEVVQSLALPASTTTVTVSRGVADSADDMGYLLNQTARQSIDGTSWSMVAGEWVLGLRLSDEVQSVVPSFAQSPQGYRFAFHRPVLGFGFDFDRAGSTHLGGTDGTFISVGSVERNLTANSHLRAGFGYLAVLSDTPLDSFEIFFTGRSNYTYLYVDNLSVARLPEVAVVPLPPSALLLLLGLAVLALPRALRRQSA